MAAATPAPQADFFDLLGGSPAQAQAAAGSVPIYPVVLSADSGQGLSIGTQLTRVGGRAMYNMSLANNSPGPLDGLMIQINTNSFGLQPENQVISFHITSRHL